jgi:4-diphosphocytidyl-2-C-methyl-D-erythritol kinase
VTASPGDEVRVTLRLRDAAPDVPDDGRNLAVRAARRFLEASGRRAAVEIELTKRIPSGAGLGGGSSDAGGVLRRLRDLWPDALAAEKLERRALELGADVPYFLDPQPAWVTGLGERRAPLPRLPRLSLLLLNPGLPLATAEVFRAFDALHPDPAGSPPLPDPTGAWSPTALGPRLRNDLEPAAVRLCPQIRRLRTALEACGALAVGLSGSGPTLYAVLPDRDRAERAGQAFEPPLWARVASTAEPR